MPIPTRCTGSSMHGRHYHIDGIHLSEPSPQRTPVLYQAGASARGKDFAASHAECVFLYGPSKDHTRKAVQDVRHLAAKQGGIRRA